MALARRLVTVLAVANVAVLAGAVVAAAVKDDGSKPVAANAPAGPASPTAAGPTTAATSAAPASSSAEGPAPAASATSPATVRRTHAPSARASVGAAPTSAATTPPAGSVTVVTSAPATHAPSSRKPSGKPSAPTVGAKPGTYGETTTGTITVGSSSQPADGTATLVVSKPNGSDQMQSMKSDQSTSEEIGRFGTDGSVRLTYLHIANQAFDDTFHFPTPETILPAHPAAGMSYSWTATSDDGKTTLSYSGSIKGTEDVKVGGVVVHCIVIHSTLKLSGGTTLTVDQTDDFAPAYKLIVREHQVAQGKYSVISYTADITTTLNRLSPQ